MWFKVKFRHFIKEKEMRHFKKAFPVVSFGISSLALFSSTAFSSNIQDFSGISYSNPAELTLFVKQAQIILGDEYLSPAPHIDFTGTITVPDPSPFGNNVVTVGTSSNINSSWFPYARAAMRLSKQFVVGIDITQPIKSDIGYSVTSPARYATTLSELHLTDYSPSVAYQFGGKLEKLALGAGFDAMYAKMKLNNMYPSFPSFKMPFGAGTDNQFMNSGDGWGYGWHAGALYHLFEPTFLGVTYFSAVKQKFFGTSTFTGFPDNPNFNTYANLPATTVFSISQFLSKKWGVQAKAYYSQWDKLQNMVLQDTAGPASSGIFLFDYNNTWRYELATRYQFTPKLNLGALFGYDQTPTVLPQRVIGLPGFDQTLLGATAEYNITDQLAVKGTYGHVFKKTVPLNTVDPNTGTTTVGNATEYGNLVGLQLTLNI